ncbi:MAG: hypothetical protein IJT46_00260 [Bacteroidaceae bacterium]|nr:hypothetical protein [Bacteroidaceae bacterium]MBQ8008866.1 hypothetical protein [Bacteroidaceae bacterium]
MKEKRLCLMAIAVFSVSAMKAQDNVLSVEISADFVSQYIWRGLDAGNASLQPTLGISYKGLSVSAWGSIGLVDSSDTNELDLTVSYSAGGFNVGITDYWFNVGADPESHYFKYSTHSTNHLFEANVGYDFGLASIQWYSNFAGNDGLNNSGKRAYSSYVELAVPFSLGDIQWNAMIGAVPYATDFYGTDGFAVTNLSLLAVKEITVSDKFGIPVFAGINANPYDKRAYLVFGLTLRP